MKTRHTSQTNTPRPQHSSERSARTEIIDWLRNAYAMERGLESSLEKACQNDELSPDVRESARIHLEETRRHAEDVKVVLQSLGTDTSALKTSLGSLAQGFKGLASGFASDERIKDLLDAYSMEHFEIACYTALAAAAERAGLPQVAQVCNRIIPDEERMADSLMDFIPEEVTTYLFETESRSE